MISVELKWDLSQIKAAGFSQKMDRVMALLLEKIDGLSNRLQTRVIEKLSGAVLRPRTGTLIESVEVIPARITGGTLVTGGVRAGGGAAFYGPWQEAGIAHGWDIVAVDKKTLRFMADGAAHFARMVVHPALPARSFMESTATEEQAAMLDEMAGVVREGLIT